MNNGVLFFLSFSISVLFGGFVINDETSKNNNTDDYYEEINTALIEGNSLTEDKIKVIKEKIERKSKDIKISSVIKNGSGVYSNDKFLVIEIDNITERNCIE